MCHLSNFYGSFYISICGFISRDIFLHETRVLDHSYLRFKVQLPTSDCTEITAGSPKVPICTPRHPLAEKIYLYLTRVLYHI